MKNSKTQTSEPARKTAPRKTAAKPLQGHGTPGANGKLTRQETTKLLMQAREAFDLQSGLGRVEPGETFDAWRRDQVMDCVDRPGISKIDREQWRSVMAHFLTLSGKEDEAFELLNRTGQKRDHGNPNDTFESCEVYVSLIKQALADHLLVQVTDERGHIRTGWFLAAARQRTNKPTLIMDTLAVRLDPRTLSGLLSHIRNHIAKREGRDDPAKRAPRSYPKPADPGDFDHTF